MSNTLEKLVSLLTRTVWLLTEEHEGRLHTGEVAPDTAGALEFAVRRVDVNSVSVMALRAALDEHELIRYAKQAASHASKASQDADADGPPPEPEDVQPEDTTMRAIATSLSMHAVLSVAMIDPTYEQARSAIHGTALEAALYRAVIHWSPEVADPKAPAGS